MAGLLLMEPDFGATVVMMGAAAAMLLFTVGNARGPVMDEGPLESDALMSPVLAFDGEPCSRLPSGMGFQCKQTLQASFIASR